MTMPIWKLEWATLLSRRIAAQMMRSSRSDEVIGCMFHILIKAIWFEVKPFCQTIHYLRCGRLKEKKWNATKAEMGYGRFRENTANWME
mmetsp:Transcript_348/g.706  ORF Transcript_348/g.706 Transcript_348/m.706 type:complete len:89 (+) Transcript_348:1601-1867(+)